jgi:hypothetical protein
LFFYNATRAGGVFCFWLRLNTLHQGAKGSRRAAENFYIEEARLMFNIFLILTLSVFVLFSAPVLAAPPANDSLANAQVLNGANGTANATTVDATRESGESAHSASGTTVYRTVWFSWTAAESKPVTFRVTAANGFNPAMMAYSGALTPVSRNNDTTGNLPRIEFEAIAGQQYRIVVGLYNDQSAAGGDFTLEWAQTNAPTNDNFANATTLETLTSGSVALTTQNATREAGEPVHIGDTSKSVWVKLTNNTASDVSLTFSTRESFSIETDTTLSIYTGDTLAALTAVVKNDDVESTSRSRATFLAKAGVTYSIAVDMTSESGRSDFILSWATTRIRYNTEFPWRNNQTGQVNYFDSADITVFRPSTGSWYWLTSGNNTFRAAQFGQAGDLPVPADYDGDLRSDLAVTRNVGGAKFWYIQNSFDDSFRAVQWGLADDKAMPGDYDFDGRMDIAVFRPSTGFWYVLRSKDNQLAAVQWGAAGDIPVTGDFRGTADGTDFAVFRPSNGTWYINDGTTSISTVFGQAGDIPVPGRYAQVGVKTDVGVFRPSNGFWYYKNSAGNSFQSIQWGTAGDVPQPGDFDNNSNDSADFVVFRPSDNTWYIRRNGGDSTRFVQFGAAGDIPASSASQLAQ